MGMPLKNGNIISVKQRPNVDPNSRSPHQRNSSTSSLPSASSPAANKSPTGFDRKHSAPELPPIGIRPTLSSYSSPSSHRQYDSPLELSVDVGVTRCRRSPLSPSSTLSSHDGSHNRSLRVSPSASGHLNRSRTWTGDLNNSQHGSSKLETLYEATTSRQVTVESGIKSMSLVPDTKNTSAATLTTAPAIEHRHMNIRSTQTVTLVTPTQQIPDSNNNTKHPEPPASKAPSLTTANLLKHRTASQGSNLSSQAVAATRANSDTGYDTDDEKDTRIVEWLLGVEQSQTEQPPEVPDLNTNEKRDTAIHIVYEGD